MCVFLLPVFENDTYFNNMKTHCPYCFTVQCMQEQVFNTGSSNWTEYTESSQSLGVNQWLLAVELFTGDWEHSCHLSLDLQIVQSILKDRKSSKRNRGVIADSWLLSRWPFDCYLYRLVLYWTKVGHVNLWSLVIDLLALHTVSHKLYMSS